MYFQALAEPYYKNFVSFCKRKSDQLCYLCVFSTYIPIYIHGPAPCWL